MLFGIAALLWPRITLDALVLLFGVYALVDGAVALATAVWRAAPGSRLWYAIEGVAGLAAGGLALAAPAITLIAIVYLIAFWALFVGAARILAAIELRRAPASALWIAGFASLVVGALLVIFPETGALALAVLVGANALVFGAFFVALAVWTRLGVWATT